MKSKATLDGQDLMQKIGTTDKADNGKSMRMNRINFDITEKNINYYDINSPKTNFQIKNVYLKSIYTYM